MPYFLFLSAFATERGIERHPAVDDVRCTRDVVGRVGRKPDDGPADILRLADAP
jgi:hypothetical protein